MPDLFENRLREVVQRLGRRQERSVPAFADVVRRVSGQPERSPERGRPGRRLLVVASAIALLAVVAGSIWFSRDREIDPTTGAMTSVGTQRGVGERLDFAQMFSAVDAYYAAQPRFEWSVPSDQLLALRLEDSIDDSFSQ